MKKNIVTITIVLIALFLISGCSLQVGPEKQPNPSIVIEDMPTSDTPKAIEEEKKDGEKITKPIAEELTTEEIEKFKAELTVDEKTSLAKDIAMQMPKNSMQYIRNIFPDIQIISSTQENDPKNMLKLGKESFEYTQEADITVVVYNELETPLYVFPGKEITVDDIQNAIKIVNDDIPIPTEENFLIDVSGPGKYTSYSEGSIESTLGKKVLFFCANWAPTCRDADAELNLSVLPNGVTVFKVDYDTENDLKKKYGITSQHTFVYIDDEGNAIKKWNGGNSKEVIENI